MTNSLQQSETNADRPGLRLKKARESLNLTLDDVAKHLKSSKKIIEALEQEDSESLPQPIYVSGYLRSYADMVSLPVDDIIETYPNLRVADPVLPRFQSSTSTGVKIEKRGITFQKKSGSKSGVVIIVLLIAAVAGGLYNQKDNLFVYLDSFLSGQEPVAAKTESDDAAMQKQLQEKIQQELDQEQTQIQQAVVEEVKVASSRLLLELTENSWLEVSDATGKELLKRELKAPARRIIEGVAPFKVFLGFAAGVSINYNGLPFDFSSYIDGDVAKFRIGKAEDNKE